MSSLFNLSSKFTTSNAKETISLVLWQHNLWKKHKRFSNCKVSWIKRLSYSSVTYRIRIPSFKVCRRHLGKFNLKKVKNSDNHPSNIFNWKAIHDRQSRKNVIRKAFARQAISMCRAALILTIGSLSYLTCGQTMMMRLLANLRMQTSTVDVRVARHSGL